MLMVTKPQHEEPRSGLTQGGDALLDDRLTRQVAAHHGDLEESGAGPRMSHSVGEPISAKQMLSAASPPA